jgi:hypothetical protein
MEFDPPYPRKGTSIFKKVAKQRIKRAVQAIQKRDFLGVSFDSVMRKGSYIDVPSGVWRKV